MNAFRHRSSARGLLFLAALALLLHFASSVGMLRVGKDRFDFSAAVCTTPGTSLAASAGSFVPADSAPAGGHDRHGECKLCCGTGALALIFSPPSLPPLAGGVVRRPLPAADDLPGAARWVPHSARAPPLFS